MTCPEYSCGISAGDLTGESKLALLQRTLDLMVLQKLATMGSLHGMASHAASRRSVATKFAEPRNHLRHSGATAAAWMDFSGLGLF